MRFTLILLVTIVLLSTTAVGMLTPKEREEIEKKKKEAIELFNQGEYEKALPLIDKVLELDPEDKTALRYRLIFHRQVVEPYCKEAADSYFSGNYPDAIAAWEKILQINPDDRRVSGLINETIIVTNEDTLKTLYSNVNKFLTGGQIDFALAEIEKILQINPGDERAQEMLSSTKRLVSSNTVRAHYENAYVHMQQNEYDLAIEEWKKVLEIDPSQEQARRLISSAQEKKYEDFYSNVNSLLKEGKFDAATEELEKMLVMSPDEVRAIEMLESIKKAKIDSTIKEHYERADKLVKEKQYDLAIEELNTVLEIDPTQERAAQLISSAQEKKHEDFYSYVNSLLKEGKYEAATEELEMMLVMSPDEVRAIEMLESIKKTKMDKAIKERYERADKLVKEKQYDLAIEEWNAVLEIDPTQEKAARLISSAQEKKHEDFYSNVNSLLKEGKYEAATEELEKMLIMSPDEVRAIEMLESIKKTKMDKAIKERYERADKLVKEKQYDLAIEEWNAVLEIDPTQEKAARLISSAQEKKHEDFYSNVNSLLKEGKYEAATEELEKMLIMSPNESRAIEMLDSIKKAKIDNTINEHYEKADKYAKEKQYDLAIEELNAVLEIDPTQEKAARLISSAQEKKHEDFYSYVNSLLKMRQYDEATEELKKMLVISPNESRAIEMLDSIKRTEIDNTIKEHYEKAEELAKEKKYDLAIKEWNKILEIDPNQDMASRMIASVHRKKLDEMYSSAEKLYKGGDFIKSRDIYNRILAENPTDQKTKKMVSRMDEIIKVVPQLIDKGKAWDVLRTGLAHHISDKGNPEVTVASAWLAVQLKPESTLVLAIRDFVESRHISIIRTMDPPVQDMNMIEQYLFASLNHIYEGRYDLSIQECSIVLELEPKNILALKRLGSAYFAMGRKSKARQAWEKALKLAPRDSELKEFIRQTR